MTDYDETLWRGRFTQYSPLSLVRVALREPGSDTAKWALEELDKQLVARGFAPGMSKAG